MRPELNVDQDLPQTGRGLLAGVRLALEGAAGEQLQAELFGVEPKAQAKGGRPKGALHKATARTAEIIRASAMNPLQFLHLVMIGEYGGKIETRVNAASAMLPYLYKRLTPENVTDARQLVIAVDGRMLAGADGVAASPEGAALAQFLKLNDINDLADAVQHDGNGEDGNGSGQAIDQADVSPVSASDPGPEGARS